MNTSDRWPHANSVRAGVIWIERHCFLYHLARFHPVFPGEADETVESAQVVIVRLQAARRFFDGVVAFRQLKLAGKLADDGFGDLVLDREDVFEFAVVALGPQVVAARRLDQLAGDAHPRAGLAHAALKDIADAELGADVLHLHRLALVGEHRICGR